jgi:hypothetical protein
MKNSNAARRMQPMEEQPEPSAAPAGAKPAVIAPARTRARSRRRRAIEIRDQGFAPFRVR